MLRNKRNKSNTKSNKKPNKSQIKHKSLEERLKSNRNDEEIMSQSDEGGMNDIDEDDFFQDEGKDKKERKENLDEKRLRLAKKLINKIGDEVKTKEDLEMEVDTGVDQFIMEEMKKEKHEHFQAISSNPNFNPYQTSFHKGHLSAPTAVDISFDSKLAITCSKDTRAIKWDLNTGKRFILPQFTNKPLYSCIFTPDDNYVLFGGADKHIHQMDLRSEKIVQSFKAHNKTVTGIIFDQNRDQFYSSSKDNTLKVWAVGTTQKSILIDTFYGHTGEINDMDIMPGGTINRILTCGSDRQINMWKVESQSFLQYKDNDLNLFSYDCVKSLSNETFLTGTYDGAISLWREKKKKSLCKMSNVHGLQKDFDFYHQFFRNQYEEDEDQSKLAISKLNKFDHVNIPNPIISLTSIKNSDVFFSGSCDQNLNIYKYSKSEVGEKNSKYSKDNIELFKRVELEQKGCVNAMKVNNTNEFVVLAIGKDARMGRWEPQKNAKNGICIVKLFD